MNTGPAETSGDFKKMSAYYDMIDAILGGSKTMREGKTDYLPKFVDEPARRYEERLGRAQFTNIFRDIVENLSQRPFASPVQLGENAPREFEEMAENVDGRGTDLTQFANEMMFSGLAYSQAWVLVDFSGNVDENASRAEAGNLRPYWSLYDAPSVIAVYSDVIDGREQVIHARLKEARKERDGFREETIEQIRVLDREKLDGGAYGPPTWSLWEKRKDEVTKRIDWVEVVPPTPYPIDEIPLVPFITGRRLGGWCVNPPLRDVAELQIELYQQESGFKNVRELIGFPMLAGQGVTPPKTADGKPEPIMVGPRAVLYAPMSADGQAGAWEIIGPPAESMRVLMAEIEETKKELRELGRQPLTANSGNLTVVTTAFAAAKGNSAIQAWAIMCKMTIEELFRVSGLWFRTALAAPDVMIDTDFDTGPGDDDSFAHVFGLYTAGVISRSALIQEAKRRGILSEDYEEDEDAVAVLAAMADEGEEEGGNVVPLARTTPGE